ncbi:MAG: racemase [Betaproteobacteria bacterium]|nr:racemase [Betaproteobacteria bacterium]
MRIWHQSLTVLGDLPAYEERMRTHIRNVVRSDTEVVLHGMLPGTYPANYPGDDIAFRFLFTMHSMQWVVHALNAQAEGFDAFAMCSLPDPMLAEIRTLVDIPVIGCGEICFRLAAENRRNFGMLLFIDRMAARYLQQIEEHGLSQRCVGVEPVGFRFNDVLGAFGRPGEIIDRFRTAARPLIAAGAQAIIPGEIPLNVLLAAEGVDHVDGVPLIDSLAETLKNAEMMVDSKASGGVVPERRGWSHEPPPRQRVVQVLDFYGLGKFLLPGVRK